MAVVSSCVKTILVGLTALAGRGMKFELMTLQSASLCVTLPVRTMECVWPPISVTVPQATLDLAAQPCARRLVLMEVPV